MAAAHPQEKELYQSIKGEQVKIHPLIWDVIYGVIVDSITVINLIASYYIVIQKSISPEDAEKILTHTKKIETAMKAITKPETNNYDNGIFKTIKENHIVLHPAVKELFTHYVGNDIFMINLAIGSTVSIGEAIEQGLIMGIIEHTRTMKQFMDKLREATEGVKGF